MYVIVDRMLGKLIISTSMIIFNISNIVKLTFRFKSLLVTLVGRKAESLLIIMSVSINILDISGNKICVNNKASTNEITILCIRLLFVSLYFS